MNLFREIYINGRHWIKATGIVGWIENGDPIIILKETSSIWRFTKKNTGWNYGHVYSSWGVPDFKDVV